MGVRAASRAYRRPRTAGKGQNLVGLRIWRAQPRKIPRNARRSETGPWGGQNRLWYFSEKTPHRHRQSRASARSGSPLWKAQELHDFTLGSHGRQIDRTRHARIHHQPRQGGPRDHLQEEGSPRRVSSTSRFPMASARVRAHRQSRLTNLALPPALSPTGEEVRPQGHEDRGRARGRQAQQAHLV